MLRAAMISFAFLAGAATGQPVMATPAVITMPPQAETEAYIRRCAEQCAAGDAAAMAEFMADDYQGVASTGELRTKAQQIASAREPSPYNASRIDYVTFRHFGTTIIAQGAETLSRADKGPDRRLIWTDVWMFRNNRWQVVASQDSVRP